MADAINFLETVHTVSAKSQSSTEFLETLISDPTVNTMTRLELLKAKTTLSIQDLMIRRMAESIVSYEDELEAIIAKLESKEQD